MKNYIKMALKEPKKVPIFLLFRFGRFIPDKLYLKMLFRLKMGYKLNLKNPKTFNEKLQWLKLYDRKPEYTQMVDKYEARKYIADKIGEEYLIPLLGVWDRFEDIDFSKLPEQFVLKCTHDSGSVFICKSKNDFDTKEIGKKIKRNLKRNYYYNVREWPYKNVKPRIIAEEYFVETGEIGNGLTDYKFHCFNGEARFVQVIFDRFIDKKNNMYTLPQWQFESINIDINFKVDNNRIISIPDELPRMIAICKLLSRNMSYIRVDFYYVNDRIYIGELTFSPAGGYLTSYPDMSEEWGSWIKLPERK